MSRTREVFPTGSTTLLQLQLRRTRDCAHRSRPVGLFFVFFSFGEKGACPKLAERVTLQPLALRTRFDHLKARFMFPGKRSWLAEGYWHMLLEAIWDGVSRDGPVSVLFSWRDYTIKLEKPIRRGFFFFKRCDGPNLQLQRFLNSVRTPFFFLPDNYAFNVWNFTDVCYGQKMNHRHFCGIDSISVSIMVDSFSFQWLNILCKTILRQKAGYMMETRNSEKRNNWWLQSVLKKAQHVEESCALVNFYSFSVGYLFGKYWNTSWMQFTSQHENVPADRLRNLTRRASGCYMQYCATNGNCCKWYQNANFIVFVLLLLMELR